MSEKFIKNIEYIFTLLFFATITSYSFYLNVPYFGFAILAIYAYFKFFITFGKDHKSKMHLLYICSSNLAFYQDRGELFMLFMYLERDLYNSKSFENDILTIEKFRFNVILTLKNSNINDNHKKTVIKMLKELDTYLELKYLFCKQRIKILHKRKLKEILNG